MNLNLLESVLFGLVSGLTEILPVSDVAHRNLMLQLMGENGTNNLLLFLVHAGILGALYASCLNHILRMIRAQKLARVPKRKRKRPLDVRSLMDLSLLKTMAIPMILALLLYGRIQMLSSKRILVSTLLFLNGVMLYVPQFLPGSNRDSRTLSRVEGICMGVGGIISVLPGISTVGAVSSVGSVCGVDKSYGLNMTFLLGMVYTAGELIYDLLGIASAGVAGLSFVSLIGYIFAGLAAFGGAWLAIRILKKVVSGIGMGIFAYYCWGLSLFLFILYLAT